MFDSTTKRHDSPRRNFKMVKVPRLIGYGQTEIKTKSFPSRNLCISVADKIFKMLTNCVSLILTMNLLANSMGVLYSACWIEAWFETESNCALVHYPIMQWRFSFVVIYVCVKKYIYMQVWKYPPNHQPWVVTTQGW